MKTTLEFDDRLIREAKKRASEAGESLTSLIHRALRAYLHSPRQPAPSFRLELLTKRGRPRAGVDWDDRNSLYERMEDRG